MWDNTDINMLVRLILAGATLQDLRHELGNTRTDIMKKIDELMLSNDIYKISKDGLYK